VSNKDQTPYRYVSLNSDCISVIQCLTENVCLSFIRKRSYTSVRLNLVICIQWNKPHTCLWICSFS